MRTPPIWNIGATLNGNFASTRQWSASGFYTHNELGSDLMQWNARLSGRPSDRLELRLEPRYEHGRTSRQFVETFPGGPDATYGVRYVYARIDRSTLAAQVRATLGFTPNLTLEGYAEPFVSTGRYDQFGELVGARDNRLLVYGTQGTTFTRDANDVITVVDGADTLVIAPGDFYRADFRTWSFRSNVVLRWEWRAGSTFFLIWQNNRGDTDPSHQLARVSDLWDSIVAPGDQFVAVKVTYWLPLTGAWRRGAQPRQPAVRRGAMRSRRRADARRAARRTSFATSSGWSRSRTPHSSR